MRGEEMSVGSWIALTGPCPVRHSVSGGQNVEFAFRSGAQTFDIVFDAEALETFLWHATEALRELREVDGRPPVSLRSRRWGCR